jgi:site-specific DNA recombinase
VTVSNLTKTAVIYARISEDKHKDDQHDDTELGDDEGFPGDSGRAVRRQIRACRAFALDQGITVTKVYADNDISATKGKRRPQFEKMLKDRPPMIIAWHQDRLLRLTKELERVIELDIPIHTVQSGIVDLSTSQGRAVARTVAAWSTYEGEHKSARQDEAITEFFDAGEPVPGKRRFGFLAADAKLGRRVNVKADPVEAEVVRALFQSYLDGRSIVSLAKELGWRTLRVRETLSNPSYAHKVVRRGEVREAADHVDRIIDQRVFDDVQARLATAKAPHHVGGVIKHVASGIARCGVCDNTLTYRNSYLCLKDLSHPTIKKEFLETKITEAVILDLLFGKRSTEPTEASRLRVIEARLRALQTTEDELAEALAGGMKWRALKPQQDAVNAEREELETEHSQLLSQSVQASMTANLRTELWDPTTRRVSLDKAAELKSEIRTRYAALDMEQKRELVRALPPIKVYPGRGPERIVIE